MSLTLLVILLFAAALHATWNTIVKGAADKLLTAIMVSAVSGLISLVILPFVKPPTASSWWFIMASLVLQICYMVLVANAYRIADISQTYPVMRGTAPLLVAIVSSLLLGQSLSLVAWLGIILISLGILGMAIGKRVNYRGLIVALITAVVIASYTLIDGTGIGHAQATAAYILWLFLLTAIPLVGWAMIYRRTDLIPYLKANYSLTLIGGIGNIASYGIALWAMTKAPIAIVAALRETAILFALLIAVIFLKETINWQRCVMVLVILAGVITLRLG